MDWRTKSTPHMAGGLGWLSTRVLYMVSPWALDVSQHGGEVLGGIISRVGVSRGRKQKLPGQLRIGPTSLLPYSSSLGDQVGSISC